MEDYRRISNKFIKEYHDLQSANGIYNEECPGGFGKEIGQGTGN